MAQMQLLEATHVRLSVPRVDATITCKKPQSTMNMLQLTRNFYRLPKLKPMVPIGRSSVHHRRFGDGAGHGTRTRLPLLRPRAKKIGTEHDMGVYGIIVGDYVPVVFLGILVGV